MGIADQNRRRDDELIPSIRKGTRSPNGYDRRRPKGTLSEDELDSFHSYVHLDLFTFLHCHHDDDGTLVEIHAHPPGESTWAIDLPAPAIR